MTDPNLRCIYSEIAYSLVAWWILDSLARSILGTIDNMMMILSVFGLTELWQTPS
jgi:hypothetical protein